MTIVESYSLLHFDGGRFSLHTAGRSLHPSEVKNKNQREDDDFLNADLQQRARPLRPTHSPRWHLIKNYSCRTASSSQSNMLKSFVILPVRWTSSLSVWNRGGGEKEQNRAFKNCRRRRMREKGAWGPFLTWNLQKPVSSVLSSAVTWRMLGKANFRTLERVVRLVGCWIWNI